MSKTEAFLAEFKRETASTKRMLERVPIDKLAWRPHEKSNSLEQLAKHIANLPNMLYYAIIADERNLAGLQPLPPIESKEQLMSFFEENCAKVLTAFESFSDDSLSRKWELKAGDRVFISTTKEDAIRYMYFNHSIHHRGQLSVYLRLLDVPVPGMYGPTADEQMS
ncbi:MAG: DinB family protein [Saprospiraceae bacterium]|nr:DinB family protein [Saprospiraceae bacterium]